MLNVRKNGRTKSAEQTPNGTGEQYHNLNEREGLYR